MSRTMTAMLACVLAGCRTTPHTATRVEAPSKPAVVAVSPVETPSIAEQAAEIRPVVHAEAVSGDSRPNSEPEDGLRTPEDVPMAEPSSGLVPPTPTPGPTLAPVGMPPTAAIGSSDKSELVLDDVIGSVYTSYPLLDSALSSRTIAAGEQLSADGHFDLKLKGASESGSTGFYRTFRHSVGLIQPLYQGGEVFAGYRVGRGSFEPWYKERQTNDGGEFKAGVLVPLARNRDIDDRRADVWRSTYGRQLVEHDIQAQLIGFVQEASYVYWDWVAAGEKFRIAERVLKLAEDRTGQIRRQVEEDFLDPPELTDNLRLVAERRAKVADAERKLERTAVKLSLYFRDITGARIVPDKALLPGFPEPEPCDPEAVAFDVHLALTRRPEIGVLNMVQRQLDVDLAAARNMWRPEVDAVFSGSQDVGYPTSPKNDKGEFELDASVFVDVPLQRRKALGKIQAVEGKISQLNAKRRLTNDKIAADVEGAHVAMRQALEQVRQARQAVEFAEKMAQLERRSFEEGASDLLKVTLREQYAAESAEKTVEALFIYFQARVDYRAALALDKLP